MKMDQFVFEVFGLETTFCRFWLNIVLYLVGGLRSFKNQLLS